MKTTARACVFAMAMMLPAGHAVAGVRMVNPERGTRMWLSVGGEERMYFRLESGETTTVHVEGPGEIKFIMRGITSTDAPTSTLLLDVLEGDRRLKRIRAETLPVDLKWKDSAQGSTQPRSGRLRVPAGEHVLRVAFQSGEVPAVGVRYAFRSGEAGKPQAPFQPQGTRETVTLLVKEKRLDYYIADASSPVKVDVIGPSRLRVVSRLIFREGARGSQRYEIVLLRDGDPLPNQVGNTTKSSGVECESHPEWILGTGETFYVDIPKGKHSVELRLANAEFPGVALRFSIPKKDIANGS